MNKIPSVILFDLGGVLVEWNGIEPLIKLSDGRLTTDMARRFWLESPWVKKFETGRCRPQEFAVGVIEELNLSLNADEFLKQFVSWDRGLLPGALDLLVRLRSQFLLVCLSNNNELHWAPLRDKAGLDKQFDYCFISHEIGIMKPSEEAFLHVLKRVGKKAEEFLFFDDNPECIETARSLGMSAFCVSGVTSVESVLKKMIPTIKTERLVLRPFELQDAAEVQRLAGDRAIADTTLNIPHPYLDGMAEEWISKHQEQFAKVQGLTFAVTCKIDGSLVGAISLMNIEKDHQGELGYWIGKSFWNQGFCTEAGQALLRFAFKDLALFRVHARHITRNPASGRVMQKLDMRQEGKRRHHARKWGQFDDVELYGILKEEWKENAS